MGVNLRDDTLHPTLTTTIVALSPFAFGYFLSYLFRAVNAIIERDLVTEIGLSPAELGLVTAAYLGAFALFQLPLGVLLDRYGPRRVQSALLMVGGCGALIFAFGKDATMLIVGRALIGLGFAGGLMASFKAVVIWVSEPRRALGNALVMSAGAIGLLVATAPIEVANQLLGWRGVFIGLAAVTFAAALIILIVVPEKHTTAEPEPLIRQVSSLAAIFSDRAFLAIAPLLATTAGVHVAVQTLWAGPWFRDVAGLDRDGVALYLMMMAIAFFVGILVTGAVADWFVRRGFSVLTVMFGFLAVYLIAQVGIVQGRTDIMMPAMWFTFATLGQASILAYPWLASHFGAARSGRAQTAANLLIFAAAFGVQYAIGIIIEQFPVNNSGGYDLASYRVSFGAALALQLAAVAWFALNYGAFRRSGPPPAQNAPVRVSR